MLAHPGRTARLLRTTSTRLPRTLPFVLGVTLLLVALGPSSSVAPAPTASALGSVVATLGDGASSAGHLGPVAGPRALAIPASSSHGPKPLRIENVTVNPGAGASYLILDPIQDEIFVTNVNGNNITVINGTNDAVLGVISPVNSPYLGTYDPEDGDLYVASYYQSQVLVINATNWKTVASINVGPGPTDCAYDPSTDEVLVSENTVGGIGVINGSSNKLVTTIATGGYPYYEFFDPVTERLFALGASNGAAIIDAANDSLLGYVPGSASDYGGGIDPASGTLFLANDYGTNLTLVNASTGKPTGSVGIGTVAGAVVVDPVTGTIIATNENFANVTVLNATSDAILGTANVGTYPQAALVDPSTGAVYVVNSGPGTVTVLLPPIRVSLADSPSMTDIGVSLHLVATASGGEPPYRSYSWAFGDGNSTNGTRSEAVHTYASAGPFNVSVRIADAQGFNGTAVWPVTVRADPVAGSVRSLENATDAGENATLVANASEGIPPYSYHWSGLPPGCVPSGAQATCRWPDAGTWPIQVSLIDSIGVSSPAGPVFELVVDQYPSVAAPSANRSAGDVGQMVLFSSAASAGDGPFTYAWNGLPAGCGGTTASIACLLAIPENLSVSVSATDATGALTLSSPALPFTVDALPVATVLGNASTYDAVHWFSMRAMATAGSGVYSIVWQGLPPGCTTDDAAAACFVPSPSAPTTYSVTVLITDSNGGASSSGPHNFTVVPALSAPPIESPAPPTLGRATEFEAGAAGGQAPYYYSWSFGDGTWGNGSSVSHLFARPGHYLVQVWVNDSGGESALVSKGVTVPAPPAPPAAPAPPLTGWLVAGVLLAGIATVLALLIRRRRATVRRPRRSRPGLRRRPTPSANRSRS
jgi:YVTN family beta-propeller protein